MNVLLVLPAMSEVPVEDAARALALFVEGVATVNQAWLKDNRRLAPALADAIASGRVRFEDSALGWKDAPSVFRSGAGNCKDLVAWRLAERRLAGEEVSVHILWSKDREGKETFHVAIMGPDGLEDPSKTAGMR